MAGFGIERKPTTSNADRQHKFVSEHSQVVWREPVDIDRRKRLEQVAENWLKHYFPNTYTRPFEKPHKEIIAGALKASATGGRFDVAGERGIGKSAVLWGILLYLAISGQQVFPIYVPWSDKALKRAFRFWKNALCFNRALCDDYPEYCLPFAHAKGIPQRVGNTTWNGGPHDGQMTGAQLTVGEGLIVFPNKLGCMGSSTINGNIRGLNHPQEDGTVLRPTIALLDDVQDRKVAKSPQQIIDTIEIIDGDIAGAGASGRDLPMLMSGNCIYPEDVMAHYLTSQQWQSLKIPCILQWPDGFTDDKSNCRGLWEEWKDLYLAGNKEAMKLYKENKRVMTAGMKLSAPTAYKGKRKDPLYEVMKTYYKMGHEAFFAEKQQDPQRQSYSVYILTPKLIESRATDRDVFAIPEWTQAIIATTDINPSYALTSVVLAFGRTTESAVLWYGLFKSAPLPVRKEETEMSKKKKIYDALSLHGKQLAGLSCRPGLWVIDGGGSPEGTVIQFAANAPKACGLQAVCSFGRGWRNYRPTSRAGHKIIVGEQLHRVIETRERQWIIYNADYWREIAQRAWTGEPGSPGSCSLPKGKHSDFATQICREQLQGKDEVGGRVVWVWNAAPGPHDYGDCMQMGYMAAAIMGLGSNEQPTKVQQRRRVRHISI